MEVNLYARNQAGEVKLWSAKDNGQYIQITTGLYSGKLYTRNSIKTKRDEFQSVVLAKRREGYKTVEELAKLANTTIPPVITESWIYNCLPKTNVDLHYNLKPMKCQPFKRGKKYPRAAQPKLNGIRSVLAKEILEEGTGTLFNNTRSAAVLRSKSGFMYDLPHITNNVPNTLFDSIFGELALDGELYIHGVALNKINSAIPMIYDNGTIAKSSRPELIPRVTFNIFDLAIEDVLQMDRLLEIGKLSTTLSKLGITNIQVLPYIIVHNDEEALKVTNYYISLGYEGAVFRELDVEYKFGSRPMSIMKLKFSSDAEFEIVDVIPKDKEDTALFVLRNDINNETFECNPMGTYEERKEYLDNKEHYIGKMATVKFFERSGVKQCPFHANVVTVRKNE